MCKKPVKQKNMKKAILPFLLAITLLFQACNNTSKPKTTKEDTLADQSISDLSIYNLPTTWTTKNGTDMELKELRGNVLVMVMIYTSCQAACPRLVADMRNIRERVDVKNKDRVKYVLVSIDPETDTPERLTAFAKENQMEDDQWVFLRSSDENTREFAAVLAVNYKRISPIDFSHSNIISVFNTEGELAYQQEGLGVSYDEAVIKIKEELAKIQ